KALAKDPSARYQTCRELAEDLKNYKALGEPSAVFVAQPSAIPTASPAWSMGTAVFEPGGTGIVPGEDSPRLETRAGMIAEPMTLSPAAPGAGASQQPSRKPTSPLVLGAIALIMVGVLAVAFAIWRAGPRDDSRSPSHA